VNRNRPQASGQRRILVPGRVGVSYFGLSPFTTGFPAATQPWYPPFKARAFAIPSFTRSSAARALVCSSGQAQ